MPARRKVSARQMELLVQFAESHRNIAWGRLSGGPQAQQNTRAVWASLAAKLNSVAGGPSKTPDQWRRYWIEFKAKTKCKAADSRRNTATTGGGANKLVPLNKIEKRVIEIMSNHAVLEHQVEDTENPIISSSPPPIDADPFVVVEVLEESENSTIISPLPMKIEHNYSELNEPKACSPELRQEDSCRDETVPDWVYELESRSVAAVERHAAAMEQMVEVMREIRDDIRKHLGA